MRALTRRPVSSRLPVCTLVGFYRRFASMSRQAHSSIAIGNGVRVLLLEVDAAGKRRVATSGRFRICKMPCIHRKWAANRTVEREKQCYRAHTRLPYVNYPTRRIWRCRRKFRRQFRPTPLRAVVTPSRAPQRAGGRSYLPRRVSLARNRPYSPCPMASATPIPRRAGLLR